MVLSPSENNKRRFRRSWFFAIQYIIFFFICRLLTANILSVLNVTCSYKQLSLSTTESLLQSFLQQGSRNSNNAAQVKAPPPKDTRPIFVLHVGLPKTGTTFLQCSLCSEDYKLTESILLEDNFVYLGTCPTGDCGYDDGERPEQFMSHWGKSFFVHSNIRVRGASWIGPVPHENLQHTSLPKLEPDFLARVERVRLAGHNAMVIFEGCHVFSPRHIHALAAFLNPNWNVQILVAYRPLYEWLPSKYNSINKPSRNEDGKHWGKLIPPFDIENRSEFSDYFDQIETWHQHPTEIVRENYALRFRNVHVLPLHQLEASASSSNSDPLLEYMFCTLLHAPHTCQAVRAGQIGASSSFSNPSFPLNYDILAETAYEQGLIHNKGRRRTVSAITRRQERKLNRTEHDFALECLSNQTLHRLENLSLSLERQLFSLEWTPEQQDTHHQGFQRALLHKHKFCHIDANKTLQDPEWRSFFQSLGK